MALVLAWLVYFCSWITALNSHNELPHAHWQTNVPGNTASCCFPCLETTLQGSVLRAVLSVVSAPPCRSVDAASEREEGDMDALCSVAVLRGWKICVWGWAQSLCSVWCETMAFMKSVDSEVRVPKLLWPWVWQFMSALPIYRTSSPKLQIVSLESPV